MAVEIAGIALHRVHHIETLEHNHFIYHHIPGMQGNIAQNLGRDSVRLKLQGIFYGENAAQDLERLRSIYKDREAVDFLAEVVGQAYFSQVILEQFEVVQSTYDPGQFSYTLTIAEFKPLTAPPGSNLASVEASIQADAASFMSVALLPDALQIGALPEITNPVEPLRNAITPIADALKDLDGATEGLKQLFNL